MFSCNIENREKSDCRKRFLNHRHTFIRSYMHAHTYYVCICTCIRILHIYTQHVQSNGHQPQRRLALHARGVNASDPSTDSDQTSIYPQSAGSFQAIIFRRHSRKLSLSLSLIRFFLPFLSRVDYSQNVRQTRTRSYARYNASRTCANVYTYVCVYIYVYRGNYAPDRAVVPQLFI